MRGMSMGVVLTAVAVGTMAAGVIFGGYAFDLHLEDYSLTKAEVLHSKCQRECKETCLANGITEANCDCRRCKVYLK